MTKILTILLLFVWNNLTPVRASIPSPEALIYGTVQIADTILQNENIPIDITLRVGNQTIAHYTMGDRLTAANHYVLRIPIDNQIPSAPGTVKTGEMARLFIANSEAYWTSETQITPQSTLTIPEPGAVQSLNLKTPALPCRSSQSGSLLSVSTFGGQPSCALLNQHFIVQSGHIVVWNGGQGPLSGTITIEKNGIFRITANANLSLGRIILAGGTLDLDANLLLGNLEQNQNSIIDFSAGTMASITKIQTPSHLSLILMGAGTLKVLDSWTLAGSVVSNSVTLDLRGTQLNLGQDLTLSQPLLITNASTQLQLSHDVTLTTNQPIEIGSLQLNGYHLSLGSLQTDLILYDPLILEEKEQFNTGLADVTFGGHLTLKEGHLLSQGGVLNLKQGASFEGGILSLSGTVLHHEGPIQIDGTTFLVDTTNQIPPLSNPGNSQTVTRGDVVILNGAESYDIDGTLTHFEWKQISGPPVELESPAEEQTSFIAPAVPLTGASLLFQLTVRDNQGFTSTAPVEVMVQSDGGHLVSMTKEGAGNGRIFSEPSGIQCGFSCRFASGSFGSQMTIRFTAIPDDTSVFVGWRGACSNKYGDCLVPLHQDQTVSAVFMPATLLVQTDIDLGHINAAGSPYRVKQNLLLQANHSLMLDPGVLIFFDPEVQWRIEGSLEAAGTQEHPIVLTATDPVLLWDGLRVTPTTNLDSSIKNLEISNAKIGINFQCCSSSFRLITLQSWRFKENQIGISGDQNNTIQWKNALFEKNEIAVQGPHFQILQSTFINNQIGVKNSTDSLVHQTLFLKNEVAVSNLQGTITYSHLSQNKTAILINPVGITLHHNTIRNNQEGMIILPSLSGISPFLSVENNNIYGNDYADLRYQNSIDWIASYNWWGGSNPQTARILDGRFQVGVGQVNLSPWLEMMVSTLPLEGAAGDLDGDGQLTGFDSVLLQRCVVHQQQMRQMDLSETEANTQLQLFYASDCNRMRNLNQIELVDLDDVQLLTACIAHQQLMADFNLTEAQANQATHLEYTTDCRSAIQNSI